MKGNLIAFDQIHGRNAAALMVDGILMDLLIETDAPRPGTIVRAKVDRLVSGQGGAFLKSPLGKLYMRGAKNLKTGQVVLAQVTGYAFENKAIPVTSDVLFKSRYALITPQKPGWNVSRSIKDEERRERLLELASVAMQGLEMGLILRTQAEEGDDQLILEDITTMRQIAQSVMTDISTELEILVEGDDVRETAWREWNQDAEVFDQQDAFETSGIWDAIDLLRSSHVRLHNGYDYFIEPTRAFVAVDVNTGDDHSKSAGLKATRAVIADLPRQLRLRGLGGQIVIDPAPVPKRDRQQVEQLIRNSFRHDSSETNFIGWTPLGHIELSRQRAREETLPFL